MADETAVPVTPAPTPAPPPAKPEIKELVATNLASSGATVQQLVIGELVQEEIDARVALVRKALPMLEAARGELRKASKPDVVTLNEDGSEKDSGWSKGALESRKKLAEKLSKLESAFTQALESSNFDALKKFVAEAK